MENENVPVHTMVDSTVSNNGDEARKAKSPTRTQNKDRHNLKNEPLYVQAAYELLGRKHCTLWGEFIIADHYGRLRAARWLATEMAGVEEIVTEMVTTRTGQ